MFSSTKSGQFARIMVTALVGQMAGQELVPPDPDKIESYGHLIIQALVAVVTIWAAVRKALQRPEAAVKLPADGVAVPEAHGAKGQEGPVAAKSTNGAEQRCDGATRARTNAGGASARPDWAEDSGDVCVGVGLLGERPGVAAGGAAFHHGVLPKPGATE